MDIFSNPEFMRRMQEGMQEGPIANENFTRILIMCLEFPYLDETVCSQEDFWRKRYQRKYNQTTRPGDIPGINTWRELNQYEDIKENGLLPAVSYSIGDQTVNMLLLEPSRRAVEKYGETDLEEITDPEFIAEYLNLPLALTVDSQNQVTLNFLGMIPRTYRKDQLPNGLYLMGAIVSFFNEPVRPEDSDLMFGDPESSFNQIVQDEFGGRVPTYGELLEGTEGTMQDRWGPAFNRQGGEVYGVYDITFS